MSEDRVAPRTAAGRSLLALYKGAEWDREYILAIEAESRNEVIEQVKRAPASLDSDELRKALRDLANEAARAVTEPRRFHENEDDRQRALGHEVGKARSLLLALLSAGDKAEAPPYGSASVDSKLNAGPKSPAVSWGVEQKARQAALDDRAGDKAKAPPTVYELPPPDMDLIDAMDTRAEPDKPVVIRQRGEP